MKSERRFVLDRRSLVGGTAAALLLAASPAGARPLPPHVNRSLWLLNVNTGEEIKATFWRRGAWDPVAIEELDYVMRDWRQSAVAPIDWRLYTALFELDRRTDQRGPVRLVSGYRTPETNSALPGAVSDSFHTKYMASDIWIYGEPLSRLARTARSIKAGGVGYYPNSGFIHVDVGPVRTW
mgnify:FL=1